MSEQPWIEKYRPKELKEISSQDSITRFLEKSIKLNNLPHMLFYGPPGTGKTSTILALANELFGPRLIKSRILELNASDERGISIVRNKIKKFAKMSISNASKEDLLNYPCPNFKIIILDEADSMTNDAQSALRRIIENYSNLTRFCLICNYITKIIDPLTSRCSKFRFRSLNFEIGIKRLEFILKNENIEIGSDDDKILEKIIKITNGDLRKSVNLLQSISNMGNKINNELIDELIGNPRIEIINKLIKLLKNDKIDEIILFTKNELLNKGFSGSNILKLLNDVFLNNTELNCNKKNKISIILFEYDVKISEGCNENIQLLSCLLKISSILKY